MKPQLLVDKSGKDYRDLNVTTVDNQLPDDEIVLGECVRKALKDVGKD